MAFTVTLLQQQSGSAMLWRNKSKWRGEKQDEKKKRRNLVIDPSSNDHTINNNIFSHYNLLQRRAHAHMQHAHTHKHTTLKSSWKTYFYYQKVPPPFCVTIDIYSMHYLYTWMAFIGRQSFSYSRCHQTLEIDRRPQPIWPCRATDACAAVILRISYFLTMHCCCCFLFRILWQWIRGSTVEHSRHAQILRNGMIRRCRWMNGIWNKICCRHPKHPKTTHNNKNCSFVCVCIHSAASLRFIDNYLFRYGKWVGRNAYYAYARVVQHTFFFLPSSCFSGHVEWWFSVNFLLVFHPNVPILCGVWRRVRGSKLAVVSRSMLLLLHTRNICVDMRHTRDRASRTHSHTNNKTKKKKKNATGARKHCLFLNISTAV